MGRPDYGLDAPPVVYTFAGVTVLGALVTAAGVGFGHWPVTAIGVLWLAIGVLTVIAMVLSSRVGKVRLRDRLLDRERLAEDADVLDLGPGRGLMLLGAAVRAPRGTATGIDLWRAGDQGGTSRENCLANARRLGVADRVSLVDGDMSDLPFPDGSFDLVTASLAVHNIADRAARNRTVREAARVLRPGGRLLLIDFSKTAEYAEDAAAAGLVEVERSGRLFSMYPPVRVVTAVKR
ncbi:class I SAM-dependent methyltransferase [Actinoplanes oblitus]|uniref:Class I SAM-dependent methyltransferase n=1 Tax=Actinoplanes oblitus TaxID=3040509 RepID=A0ABY8W905_9ACTN|nr:class I SAM-dependent methyltransferase [Actinoplanes oblitus]WIM94359.1 class I SAM-dependent methyltransferase [Actinoplanes oblitus]